MVLTIQPWYGSYWIIQKPQKCIFEWSKEPKKMFLAIFGVLVCWIDLILHMMIELYIFHHLATLPGHEGSFKITKMQFWMIRSAKKEVFGHFQKFGLFDRLDIAYCDIAKSFPGSSNVTRSWRTIQKSQKSIFEWSKGQKKEVLSVFWSLVCYIDLTLHIMIVVCCPTFGNFIKSWKIIQKFQPNMRVWQFSGVWAHGSAWYCILWY